MENDLLSKNPCCIRPSLAVKRVCLVCWGTKAISHRCGNCTIASLITIVSTAVSYKWGNAQLSQERENACVLRLVWSVCLGSAVSTGGKMCKELFKHCKDRLLPEGRYELDKKKKHWFETLTAESLIAGLIWIIKHALINRS